GPLHASPLPVVFSTSHGALARTPARSTPAFLIASMRGLVPGAGTGASANAGSAKAAAASAARQRSIMGPSGNADCGRYADSPPRGKAEDRVFWCGCDVIPYYPWQRDCAKRGGPALVPSRG